MRRLSGLLILVILMVLPGTAWADHVPPEVGVVPARLDELPTVVAEGPIRYVSNAQTGRDFAGTFGEVPPFVRDGRTYLVAASSYYGFSVIDVTDPAAPTVVSEYASGFGCPISPIQSTITTRRPDPLGYGAWENDISFAPDGRWVVIGTDSTGRCHDPAGGGMELVDLSDVTNPKVVHLVRNVGYAHSITLDPKRPWLAYMSSSDSNDVIDVVDFKSCIGKDPAGCAPQVARLVLDPVHLPGLADAEKEDQTTDGCHDLRFYNDLAFCAAVGSTLILDVSHALKPDGTLTGSLLTEGGSCPLLDGDPIWAPQVKVTDCEGWTKEAFLEAGGKSADIRLLSVIKHDGSKPPTEDIQISHLATAIGDGRIMIIGDERGGGLGTDVCPGGGVWFYDIRDPRHPVEMRQPDGGRGVYMPTVNIPDIAGMNPSCTSHYGREFADENLLTFAWYTNGTRVLRYFPDFTKTPAAIRFEEVASIAPIGMATDSMVLARNPDNANEVLVYSSDAVRGVDVMAVVTPRLTRLQAFVTSTTQAPVVPKPRVLSGSNDRPLAGTGLSTPADAAALLLLLAFATRLVVLRVSNRY